MTARFKKIDPSVISDYVKKVHGADSATDIDEGLWKAYYGRMEAFAEMGFGKKFDYKDPDLKDVALGQKFKHNLARFATYKQHALNAELRVVLFDEAGEKLPIADFEKKAKKLLNRFNVTYLKAEINHATQAAQMATKWREIERTAYLYPNLKYVTANDERVRDTHRLLDDIVRPINDDFWKTHYPPNGWRCRCKVVRTDDAPTALPEKLTANPTGFNTNVGMSGKLFEDDHPYFSVNAKESASLDLVNNKMEYNLFDENILKKVQFDKNAGGYVTAHKEHGVSELQANLDTARKLLPEGEKMVLLPILEIQGRKNPDILINGVLADLKILESDDALIAIQRNIKKANTQSVNHVVLSLTAKMVLEDVIKAVGYACQAGRNRSIERITLILPNDEVVTFERQAVIDRSFEDVIKKQWQKP